MGKLCLVAWLGLVAACAHGLRHPGDDDDDDRREPDGPPSDVDPEGPWDLCDGQDDDADPGTPDGWNDPLIGVACTPEGDASMCSSWAIACREGRRLCEPGGGPIGTPLDLTAGLLPQERSDEHDGTIVWDGEAFVVVFSRWEDDTTAFYWMRIQPDGRRITGPTALTAHAMAHHVAAASAGDGRTFVAWPTPPFGAETYLGSGVTIAIVDELGRESSRSELATEPAVSSVGVAAGATGGLVTFLLGDAAVTDELAVWAVAVDPSGSFGTPVEIGATLADDWAGRVVAAAPTDDGWAVAWKNANGPRVRVLDADGAPVGPEVVPAPDYTDAVDLARGPEGLAMAWRRPSMSTLHVRLLDQAAEPRAEALEVAPTSTALYGSSMAWLDWGYGIAWAGRENEGFGIQFSMVSDDGQVLCPARNLVCSPDPNQFAWSEVSIAAGSEGVAGIVYRGIGEDGTGVLQYVRLELDDCPVQ
jgi:hypothetical protein